MEISNRFDALRVRAAKSITGRIMAADPKEILALISELEAATKLLDKAKEYLHIYTQSDPYGHGAVSDLIWEIDQLLPAPTSSSERDRA